MVLFASATGPWSTDVGAFCSDRGAPSIDVGAFRSGHMTVRIGAGIRTWAAAQPSAEAGGAGLARIAIRISISVHLLFFVHSFAR